MTLDYKLTLSGHGSKAQAAMMGRQATMRELFIMISLNEYVSKDHLRRAVDGAST